MPIQEHEEIRRFKASVSSESFGERSGRGQGTDPRRPGNVPMDFDAGGKSLRRSIGVQFDHPGEGAEATRLGASSTDAPMPQARPC